jgi:hypothetical protein
VIRFIGQTGGTLMKRARVSKRNYLQISFIGLDF